MIIYTSISPVWSSMFIGNHGGTLRSSKLLCFDSKAFQLKEGVFVRLTIPPKWLNGTLHGGFGLLFIVWLVYMGLWTWPVSCSTSRFEFFWSLRSMKFAVDTPGVAGAIQDPHTCNAGRGWGSECCHVSTLVERFCTVCQHWLLIARDSIMTNHQDNNVISNTSNTINIVKYVKFTLFQELRFAAGVCQKRGISKVWTPFFCRFLPWCPGAALASHARVEESSVCWGWPYSCWESYSKLGRFCGYRRKETDVEWCRL